MPVVASYNIINATNNQVTVENVTLTKLGEKAGIVFRSPTVDRAVAQGLITIENTLSDTNKVANITLYVNELAGVNPVVEPMPVGTPI